MKWAWSSFMAEHLRLKPHVGFFNTWLIRFEGQWIWICGHTREIPKWCKTGWEVLLLAALLPRVLVLKAGGKAIGTFTWVPWEFPSIAAVSTDFICEPFSCSDCQPGLLLSHLCGILTQSSVILKLQPKIWWQLVSLGVYLPLPGGGRPLSAAKCTITVRSQGVPSLCC